MERFLKKWWALILAVAFMIMIALIAPQAQAADKVFCKGMTGESDIDEAFVFESNKPIRDYTAFVAIAGERNRSVVVGSLSCTSDGTAATNNAYIYDKEDYTAVDAAAALGADVIPTADTGTAFDVDDIVCIQSPGGRVVQVATVANVGGGSIEIYGTLAQAVGTGWYVYEMEEIARVPVGNATASYESDVAVVAGEPNSPLLVLLGGNSACSINFCSGHYK